MRLHIRNAPTRLMKELGYGKGYMYDPSDDDGVATGQQYLPDGLVDARWYEPTGLGYEKTVAERLELFRRKRG